MDAYKVDGPVEEIGNGAGISLQSQYDATLPFRLKNGAGSSSKDFVAPQRLSLSGKQEHCSWFWAIPENP